MGPCALQALALVSEVIHGTPSRFSNPARFSFAHGGKDRRPFPVPTKIYDRTIAVLGAALRTAKLGDTERTNGFKRLHAFTRMVEDTFEPYADLDTTIAKEYAESAGHGGRSICGWEKPPTQLQLWSEDMFANYNHTKVAALRDFRKLNKPSHAILQELSYWRAANGTDRLAQDTADRNCQVA